VFWRVSDGYGGDGAGSGERGYGGTGEDPAPVSTPRRQGSGSGVEGCLIGGGAGGARVEVVVLGEDGAVQLP
jgi:hypothetical protein